MNKRKFLNIIKLTGKLAIIFLTGLLVFFYIIALIEKIKRPAFKNLPVHEFIIIGIILLILLFISLKWIFEISKSESNK